METSALASEVASLEPVWDRWLFALLVPEVDLRAVPAARQVLERTAPLPTLGLLQIR